MKIIHTGDWHFEEAKHRRPGADGVDQGWHDVATAVAHVVDHAIECAATEPTVLMFGGDLARSRKPSPHTYRFVAQQFRRLHAAGVPVVAIPGNHDIDTAGSANALEPLGQLPGVHLFNEPGVAYLYPPSGVGAFGLAVERDVTKLREGDVQAAIVCMPWVQRSVAAASLPPGTPLDEVLRAVGEATFAIIRDLVWSVQKPSAGTDVPVMVAWHGTVAGGQTATGQDAHLFKEAVLSPIDLDGLRVAGVMLNHLHKRQSIGHHREGAVPILYSSSVERLTHGDATDTKGAVEWTLPERTASAQEIADGTDPRASYRWIDTPARRFVTVEHWHPDGATFPADVEDAIVRVRIDATEQPLNVTANDITRTLLTLAGAHAVTEVSIDTGDVRVQHDAADAARTDPLQALVDWLAVEKPDAAQSWRDQVVADAASLLGRDVPTVQAVGQVVVDGVDITDSVTATTGMTPDDLLPDPFAVGESHGHPVVVDPALPSDASVLF